MTTAFLASLAELAQAPANEPGTAGIRTFILDNIVPLLLLVVALLLLWLGGGKGDNSGVMRRLGGVIVALAIIGLAVSNAGVGIGEWLASLFTNS